MPKQPQTPEQYFRTQIEQLIESLEENFQEVDEDGDSDGVVDTDLIIYDLQRILEDAPTE